MMEALICRMPMGTVCGGSVRAKDQLLFCNWFNRRSEQTEMKNAQLCK